MEGWQTLRAEIGAAIRKLAELPEGARADVRDELEILRRLVVGHREPRLAIVGKMDVSLHEIMESIGATSEFDEVRERLGLGRWYEHTFPAGMLHVADLRSDATPNLRALEYEAPDVVVAVARSEDEDVDGVAGALFDALELVDDTWGAYPPAIAIVFRTNDGRNAGDFKTMQAFRDAFAARGLPRDWVDVESTARIAMLSRTLLPQLPLEARFALARLTEDLATKREVAFELTRLASTLNAAIASVPIPIAGALPITSIQIAMVAGIAMLSGRPLTLASFGEFAAAIGLNVGAAIAFREIARALIAWIPVAGPVISASIAAGATLTLGKAATRYYLTE